MLRAFTVILLKLAALGGEGPPRASNARFQIYVPGAAPLAPAIWPHMWPTLQPGKAQIAQGGQTTYQVTQGPHRMGEVRPILTITSTNPCSRASTGRGVLRRAQPAETPENGIPSQNAAPPTAVEQEAPKIGTKRDPPPHQLLTRLRSTITTKTCGALHTSHRRSKRP
jgi:hypothetical protein